MRLTKFFGILRDKQITYPPPENFMILNKNSEPAE